MITKTTQNESALVSAARAGDKIAIRKLLERNWQWLKGMVFNILGNSNDADDALQNICVLVIDKIHTLREPERFRPWLATVARRAALAVRLERSRKPVSLDGSQFLQHEDENIPDVADTLAQTEQYKRILAAVMELPEKYREVFILKYIKDITYSEISEILDLPVTTIQIRLVRARRMIYNRLTGKPNEKVPRT